MPKFQEVRRSSLRDTVGDLIIRMIRNGDIKPGERLPSEHQLMKLLNVGRSSIREAVRGLVVMGILDSRPRKGTVVLSPIPNPLSRQLQDTTALWAVRDLFEVRLLLEEHAASAAARLGSKDDFAEIRAHAESFEKAAGDGKSIFESNLDFHLTIARAARNPVLHECLRSIIGNLRETRESINRAVTSILPRDIEEHRAIIDALERGDAKRARRIMHRHIKFYIDSIEEAARKS
jgi:GntR family transcriptional regulator, transcriptional repressor for pyruvate dehydrogenase complex